LTIYDSCPHFESLTLLLYTIRTKVIKNTIPIPIQPARSPSPPNRMVVHAPPSLSTVIDVLPSKSKLADFAVSVMNGVAHEEIYKAPARRIPPPMTLLKISPLKTGTIRQMMKGMVARSPSGRVVFPGRITARSRVIGTSSREAASTEECPTASALSIPMNSSLPGNFFLTQSVAASDIGERPSMRRDTILG